MMLAAVFLPALSIRSCTDPVLHTNRHMHLHTQVCARKHHTQHMHAHPQARTHARTHVHEPIRTNTNTCMHTLLQPYTFSLWNEKLLAKQPEHVQEMFPAVLTHRSAMDRTLLQLVRILLLNRMTFSAVRDMLRQLRYLRYTRLEIQYVSKLLSWKHHPHRRRVRRLQGSRAGARTPHQRMAEPPTNWDTVLEEHPFPAPREMNIWVPSGKQTCYLEN